jgi:DNA-binding NarL/FixJ family response regulator
VLKTDAGRTLVEAVGALLRPQDFLTERVHVIAARGAGPRRAATARGAGRLTARQREVLKLLSEGKSNKEIGMVLRVSTKTVDTHRPHILAKLQLHSMSELVRYAIRNRISEP